MLVELLGGGRLLVSEGFAAVALLAAPASDAAGRVRAAVGNGRFPGDQSRAVRDAVLARGSIDLADDLWGWIRR